MKKHRYNVHAFVVDDMKKELRRAGAKKKITDAEALRAFMKMKPDTLQHGGAFLAEEFYWREGQRSIIFPDSAETLDKIRRTKFKVSLVEAIKTPFDSFILATPPGYTIDGISVPACLVTATTAEDRVKKVFGPFLDALYSKRPAIEGGDEDFIAIQTHSTNMPFRVCVPRRLLGAALESKTPEELSNMLGILAGGRTPTKEEQELQFTLIRLVCSLFVYCQATGDALTPGFPALNRPNIEGKNFKRAQDFTLGLSAKNRDGTTPTGHYRSGHYRSGHYRQLVNERYYKGEHAKQEIGSRFIWVKDTFVGTDIDPHTLQKGNKR